MVEEEKKKKNAFCFIILLLMMYVVDGFSLYIFRLTLFQLSINLKT